MPAARSSGCFTVGNAPDVKKARPSLELRREIVRRGQRHAGFAYTTRADNRYKSMLDKLFGERFQNLVATDEPTGAHWQGPRPRWRRFLGEAAARTRDCGGESVTFAGDILDVPPLPQRLATHGDVEPQVSLGDNAVRPNTT